MKARTAYVVAKSTLEARLREQMHDELANLQTQVDIAVRYAYDTGESKAAILRAMGTKFYGTLNDSLDRTQGVSELVGDDPLGDVYSWMDGLLAVNYEGHGPMEISGSATFQIKTMDDKSAWFIPRERLWNDDYTERNEAVASLDGKQDGFYYEEAIQWVKDNPNKGGQVDW
jgi:hypothetical protein